MAMVFGLVAVWPLTGGGEIRFWATGVAVPMLVSGLFRPQLLAPLNILWFRLGLLLHRIMTPLVMGVLFFLVVTPTALVMRRLGHDPLRLKRPPTADSYWVSRTPPGPDADSMTRQF